MATRSVVGVKLSGIKELKALPAKRKSDRDLDLNREEKTITIVEPGVERPISAKEGDIIAFYVHSDGYPSYLAEMLKRKSYVSILREAVLGDASSLDMFSSLEEALEAGFRPFYWTKDWSVVIDAQIPCRKHDFDNRCQGISVHYYRDRKERGSAPKVVPSSEFSDIKEFFDWARENIAGDIEWVHIVEVGIRPYTWAPKKITSYGKYASNIVLEWIHNKELGWLGGVKK